LDGWRGVFAGAVALFHLYANFPRATWSNVPNGFLCVDFFFVLSGFVLAAKVREIGDLRDAMRFVLLRLGRLYPLHIFTLSVLVTYEAALWLNSLRHAEPVSTFHNQFDVGAIASQLLVAHGLNVNDSDTWNIPSWSISSEFWTAVIFSGLVLVGARLRNGALLAIAGTGTAVIAKLSPTGIDVSFDLGLVRCIVGFSVGMLCQAILPLMPRPTRSSAFAQLCEVCAVAGAVWFSCVAGRSSASLLAPAVAAVLVIVFAQEGGAISRVLSSRPAQWLAQRSYSVYLTHYLVIVAALPTFIFWANKYFGVTIAGNMLVPLFIAGTLTISAFTYRWVEDPARAWTRRWVRRLHTPRIPSAATAA
jgi:peptidoglycan/LPS O-acetylase OafA/YrhL